MRIGRAALEGIAAECRDKIRIGLINVRNVAHTRGEASKGVVAGAIGRRGGDEGIAGIVSDIMAGCEPSRRHLAQFGIPFDAACTCDRAASRIGAADWPIELARRLTYFESRFNPDIGIGRGHRRH